MGNAAARVARDKMMEAIKQDDMDTLENILSQEGVEEAVNLRADSGLTPLHLAVMNGNHSAAEQLLEKGSNPNAPVEARWRSASALHHASHKGDVEMARILLEHGAIVNGKDDEGLPPIWIAGTRNNIPLTRLLMKHGADPQVAQDKYRRNALQAAMPEARAAMMEMLKEVKADDGDQRETVSVTAVVPKDDGKGRFHAYSVEVRKGAVTTTVVKRRYRQFDQLKKELKVYGREMTSAFPPKRVTKNRELDIVERRRMGLDRWLAEVFDDEVLGSSPELQAFLDPSVELLTRTKDGRTGKQKAPSAPVSYGHFEDL